MNRNSDAPVLTATIGELVAAASRAVPSPQFAAAPAAQTRSSSRLGAAAFSDSSGLSDSLAVEECDQFGEPTAVTVGARDAAPQRSGDDTHA